MNGWLVLDKPVDISSAKALNGIKKLAKPKKVGHAGTLDPFASGVLLVAIGEATKSSAYAMNNRKSYSFTLAWGENRDTIDPTGQITETSPIRPSQADIQAILHAFSGEIEQVPPAFSAININGQRSYKLARQGQAVPLSSRKVQIYDIQIEEHREHHTTFFVECGKGFYIRSLARDIAAKLGACGHVSQLRRLSIGNFSIDNAIQLDYLEKLVHNADHNGLGELLHPVHAVLDDILVQQINTAESQLLRQGQKIKAEGHIVEEQVIATMLDSKLTAICKAEFGYLKPMRVFNL